MRVTDVQTGSLKSGVGVKAGREACQVYLPLGGFFL